MFQDILMLAALFILRIAVPLLFVIGIGYTILQRFAGLKMNWSPKFVTGVGLMLSCWAVAAIALVLRFTNGIGAVTNLSDEFPLGLWIGFDVMAGAMLGGGAFVLAGLVYVFGLERYRPILRSTILTAFLGYALLIVALLVDVGRPYNIMLAKPVYMPNIHSMLWEIAMCVLCYTTVLALEFLPALFERLRWRRAWLFFHKITLPLVIVGILLSTMHQSSLGSMWLTEHNKLNPLWYTPWIPVLFWISAIGVGLSMVTVESNLSSRGFKRGLEQDLLSSLAKFNGYWLGFYAIIKLIDVVARGQAALLTQPTLQTMLFWVEVGLGAIVPAILMMQPKIRENKNALFAIGAVVVAGGSLNRLNVSVFGLWSYTGPIYIPSVMEIAVTLALFTFGGAAFAVLSKLLPVFPKEHELETVPVEA